MLEFIEILCLDPIFNLNGLEVNMKKISTVISTMLLGLGFISTTFAGETFSVTYQYFDAYVQGACSDEVTRLIKSNDHLTLTFEVKQPGSIILSGAATSGVTVPEQAQLNQEEHTEGLTAYLLDKNTKLLVGNKQFIIHQLWTEGSSAHDSQESGFYLGDNSSCFIGTTVYAETNSLAQPRG